MEFQIERAEHYRSSQASQLSRFLIRKTQLPGLVMAAIYRTVLDEISATDVRQENFTRAPASTSYLNVVAGKLGSRIWGDLGLIDRRGPA